MTTLPRFRLRDNAGMPYKISAHITEVKERIVRDKAAEWNYVTPQGKAFLKGMTKSDEEYLSILLQEEHLRRTLPPYAEIFTTCIVCRGVIQWSLVEGDPEIHAYATGAHTDPLAPGSYSDICYGCEGNGD